ncbi:MAG: oligosaccharide flippase family protein [Blastocatellia bacterium]|nr:oligosaccharide flippase family protein [Blastocatellia bacterium]
MSDPTGRSPRKRTATNALYGLATWLVPIGLSFVATPVILRSLGHSDFGIYALVLGFIGYSFTFSFGRAITKYVAEYRASGETDRIGAIVWSSILLNLLVGSVGVLLIGLLAPWLVRSVFLIEAEAQEKSIVAFYIAAVTIFATTLNQLSSSALQGLHRFDLYSKIFTASGILTIGGNLLLALNGAGLIWLLVWNLAVISVFALVFLIFTKRNLPELSFPPILDRAAFVKVITFNAGIVGYQILANLLLLFERGWITNQLGVKNLTYYVIPLTLGIQLHAFTSSLVQVVFPLASELSNDKPRLLALYLKATRSVGMVVVFAVSMVVALAPQFLMLWVGDEIANESSLILRLVVVAFGITSMLTIVWQMTEGLGRPIMNLLIFVPCLLISVTLMLLLTPQYGNIGVAIARLSGFFILTALIPIAEKLFFGGFQTGFWIRSLLSLGISAIAAVLVSEAVIQSLPLSWATLLLAGAAGGAVYFAVLLMVRFVTIGELKALR